MARKVITNIIDDLDGDEAQQSIEFSLDGVDYLIDLNDKNATEMRSVLSKYTEAATRVGRRRKKDSAAPSKSKKRDIDEVRRWGRENGFTVADRGRVPFAVHRAYEEAHA